MADQASATHPHRPKMDGSSDSICLNCLATVTAKHEADKPDVRLNHVCGPYFTAKRTSLVQQSA
jgi:hypothetical protein